MEENRRIPQHTDDDHSELPIYHAPEIPLILRSGYLNSFREC